MSINSSKTKPVIEVISREESAFDKRFQLRLLKIEEVMAKLKIGKTKVYMLANEGDLPKPVKIGKCTRWIEDEIDCWLEQKMIGRQS